MARRRRERNTSWASSGANQFDHLGEGPKVYLIAPIHTD
jgi:hypothetical protein